MIVPDMTYALHRVYLDNLVYNLKTVAPLVTKEMTTDELRELIKSQTDPRAIANLCFFLWLRDSKL